jgi:hypothetical protein
VETHLVVLRAVVVLDSKPSTAQGDLQLLLQVNCDQTVLLALLLHMAGVQLM